MHTIKSLNALTTPDSFQNIRYRTLGRVQPTRAQVYERLFRTLEIYIYISSKVQKLVRKPLSPHRRARAYDTVVFGKRWQQAALARFRVGACLAAFFAAFFAAQAAALKAWAVGGRCLAAGAGDGARARDGDAGTDTAGDADGAGASRASYSHRRAGRTVTTTCVSRSLSLSRKRGFERIVSLCDLSPRGSVTLNTEKAHPERWN